MVEQRGLQELCHRQGASHHCHRHVRVDEAALGDGMQRQTIKCGMLPQPVEKIIAKKPGPGLAGLRAQVVQVFVPKMSIPDPIEQPLQPGIHTVTGLMLAIIWITAEEVIELDITLVQAHAVVKLSHGQLICVGVEDALRRSLIVSIQWRSLSPLVQVVLVNSPTKIIGTIVSSLILYHHRQQK